MRPVIRLFQPTDRTAVLGLAADTAFFGAPVEAFLEDRRAMQDAFAAYYTDCEPEHLWVAEVDGAVRGYVTGCTGGRQASWNQARVGARAMVRFLGGRYRLGPRTWRYIGRLIGSTLHGEVPPPDLPAYPAHLHINLAESFRGRGLGGRLLQACLDQMTVLGLPGIHLNTTTLNGAALKLYEKMGFQVLARRRTRLWEPWLPQTVVENLVYAKRLNV